MNELTVTIRGREVPVFVKAIGTTAIFSANLGVFNNHATDPHDETIESHSLEDLCKRLTFEAKQREGNVAVDFVEVDRQGKSDYSIKYGVATGIHASTHNVLIKGDNGRTHQKRSYTWGEYVLKRPENEMENDRLHSLVADLNLARRAFEIYAQSHTIDVARVVKERVEALGGGDQT